MLTAANFELLTLHLYLPVPPFKINMRVVCVNTSIDDKSLSPINILDGSKSDSLWHAVNDMPSIITDSQIYICFMLISLFHI